MLKKVLLLLLCSSLIHAEHQTVMLMQAPTATKLSWLPSISTVAWYSGLIASVYVLYDVLARDGKKTRAAVRQTKKVLKRSIRQSTETISKLVSYEGWLTRRTVVDKGDQALAKIAKLEQQVADQTKLIKQLLPPTPEPPSYTQRLTGCCLSAYKHLTFQS